MVTAKARLRASGSMVASGGGGCNVRSATTVASAMTAMMEIISRAAMRFLRELIAAPAGF
ncbi:hypothetical protein D3C71_2123180 [compost metagenome]